MKISHKEFSTKPYFIEVAQYNTIRKIDIHYTAWKPNFLYPEHVSGHWKIKYK